MRFIGHMAFTLLLLFAFTFGATAQVATPPPDDTEIEIDVDEAAEDAAEVAEEVTEETTDTLRDLFERLTIVPENDLVRVLLIIGGAVLLVAGWRISEYTILIAGIIIGATFGASLFADQGELLEIIGLLLGGVIGGLLAVFVYYVAVFFVGAYVGIVVVTAFAEAFNLEPVTAVAILVAALVGGVVLLALSIELLIVLSAVVGAQMLVVAVGLDPIWTVILAVAGVLVQFFAARYYNVDIRRRPRRIRWRR